MTTSFQVTHHAYHFPPLKKASAVDLPLSWPERISERNGAKRMWELKMSYLPTYSLTGVQWARMDMG